MHSNQNDLTHSKSKDLHVSQKNNCAYCEHGIEGVCKCNREEDKDSEEIWFSVNNNDSTLYNGVDYIIVKNDTIYMFIDFDDEDGETYPSLSLEQAKILRWALNQAIKHMEAKK